MPLLIIAFNKKKKKTHKLQVGVTKDHLYNYILLFKYQTLF